jgi:hypothetical protein
MSDSTIFRELVSFEKIEISEEEIQNLIKQLPYQDEDIINVDEYIEIDNSLEKINLINKTIINLAKQKMVKKIKPELAI